MCASCPWVPRSCWASQKKTDLALKVVFNQESSYSYYFTETSVSVECSKLEESESMSLQWRNVGFSWEQPPGVACVALLNDTQLMPIERQGGEIILPFASKNASGGITELFFVHKECLKILRPYEETQGSCR